MTLGTNSKSLKKYLDDANAVLEEKAGARIISKSGSGIALEVFDEEKYHDYFVKFNSVYRGSKLLQIRFDPTVLYMVTRLMFEPNESFSADFFAEKLFLNRRAVISNYREVKKYLNGFHLDLVRNRNSAYQVAGKEGNMRIAYADHLRVDVAYPLIQKYVDAYRANRESIINVIIENLRRYHISIAEKSIDKIARLIFIGQKRYLNGYCLEDDYGDNEDFCQYAERECAIAILQQLFKDTKLDDREINYLTVLLVSRRSLFDDDNIDIRKAGNYYSLAGELLDYILYNSNIDLTVYPDIRLELARHFRGMYCRLRYGLEKKSVKIIESKINNEYYELAVLSSEFLTSKWNTVVSDSEISYLSYIFYYRSIVMSKKINNNILIFSSEGRDTSQLIHKELMTSFADRIGQVDIKDSYDLDDVDFRNYDLIITDIPDFSAPVPCFYINNYMTANDYSSLLHFFESQEKTVITNSDFFPEKLNISGMSFETEEDLISFIARTMAPYASEGADIYNSTMRREQISPTEVSNSTLLLHSYVCYASEPRLMLIKLDKPLALDQHKCQQVFYVLNGGKENNPFDLLSYMKGVVANLTLCHQILSANSYEEIYSLLTNGN